MTRRTQQRLLCAALLAIVCYVILYFFAARLYGGGNDMDRSATKFSWQYNYWCELLNTRSVNGLINPARPVAITAMILLAITLSLCWYCIPWLFNRNHLTSRIIRYSGMAAMLVLFFLFIGRSAHDPVLNTAGFLGSFALLLTLVELLRSRRFLLAVWGACCLLLVGVNNYIYYSGGRMTYLALIQKLTFILFLAWFAALLLVLLRNLPRRIPE